MNNVKSNFLGWIFRMKFIQRWGLMRSNTPENLSEHSREVSVVSHLLAIIKNKKFNGNVNADKAAAIGLYNDISGTILTDLPSMTKSWNEDIEREFKKIKHLVTVE